MLRDEDSGRNCTGMRFKHDFYLKYENMLDITQPAESCIGLHCIYSRKQPNIHICIWLSGLFFGIWPDITHYTAGQQDNAKFD